MITTYLMGGLGNQMFQYAMGRASAARLGVELQLDNSSYGPKYRHPYDLPFWSGVTERVVYGDGAYYRVCEDGMPYNPDTLEKITKECTLYGYWQTEKYFDAVRPELLEAFRPRVVRTPVEQMSDLIKRLHNSVSLHVRRTDYVGSSVHGVPLEDYYRHALAAVSEKVSSPCVFVFTDDPAWVSMRLMPTINHTKMLVSGKGFSGPEEMWLMSQCQHSILANSSYSWWGAWLNDSPDRVVTAPKQWFVNGPDSRDIIPDRWLKI